MRPLIRRRFAALLAIALCGGSVAPSTLLPTPAAANGETPVGFLYEVRLRKLHLVRPDLILYPVAYDVYC